ncbi:MAG TPA: malonyl-CoA synthase [Rhizomicrobium sp.]|jgi:malonyl-CoA/methylmalonyl-CoA synthetase
MTQQNESLFTSLLAGRPDAERVFLYLPAGKTLSYADMLVCTARFARGLWQIGVRPGDRVAAQVEKGADALFFYLACLRAGAVYLPLNPAYTPAETEYFLRDAEPSCVVAAPGKRLALEPLRNGAKLLTLAPDGTGSFIDIVREMPGDFNDVPRAADELAAILYTSGTTGRSKGAMLTQRNLLSNALALRDLWRFTTSDVLLHALPLYHTHGLFTATNTILAAGAAMILLPRFDLDDIFAQLPCATAMMGVPTFYTRLLADARLGRDSIAHMRLFVSGSAPLLPETHRAFLARTGHAILERYGMTETNMIASNPYDGERRPGAIGFPLPDVELRICAPESGAISPAGGIGTIELRGPNVFKGYWRDAEKTRSAFRDDGYFVTGDLGSIDSDGYLHIVGRARDLVISGGFNVYPGEVESEIDALSDVLESAVIGVPHPDLGEGVTAVVVCKPGAAIDEADALAALRLRLARYKLPKRVVFVDELPRNAMGKVQKAVLRETYRAMFRHCR